MKTEEQIYSFCRAHYYAECDGVEEKWQPFEYWTDEAIEECIENDVEALKMFLKD